MTAAHRRLRLAAAALGFGAAALAADPAGAGSGYLNGVGLRGGDATIAQQYDFSCGSAALATLLTYDYNIPVSEPEVFRDMFEHGDKTVIAKSGFSLLDIRNYLARRGLEANGYRAPLSKLAEVRLPAIVLVNVRGYSHFVVLEGIQNGWGLLAHPANGMRSEPIGRVTGPASRI